MSPRIPQGSFASPAPAVRIGTPSLPDVPDAGVPAQVAGRLLGQWAELEQRAIDHAGTTEGATAFLNQADQAVRTRRESYDRTSHLQSVDADLQGIRESLIKRGRAGGMSEAAIGELTQQINRSAVFLKRDERTFHTQRLHGEARANLEVYLEQETNQAIERGGDTVEGLEHQRNSADAIETAVKSGYLTPGEGVVFSEKARRKIRVGVLETRSFDDPLTLLLELESPGQHKDLTPDERLQLRQRAESRVLFLENLITNRRREEERLEKEQQRLLGQDFIRRAITGEDVSRELLGRAGELGDQFDNTFNSVRAVTGAQARGDLFPSSSSTLQEYERRLRGVGDPLTREEVVGAADAGQLNGTDSVRLLTGIEEREKREPHTPEQRAALTDAEQFIRRGLQIKVPGVDRITGADNERQNQATNLATIEFYDLEAQARQEGKPFDARRVAQSLVEKWRSFLVPEGVQEGAIFGGKTFEDAELEIGRRVRAGRLDENTARFLLRVAEQMLPRKPKPLDVRRIQEDVTTVTP